MKLKKCLNHLDKRSFRNPAPAECYQLLKFPKKPVPSNYNWLSKPKHGGYFNKKFPSKVKLTSTIFVKPNNIFKVPNSLHKQLKSSKTPFTITPIKIDDKNVYGLLYDKKYRTWTIFLYPGSNIVPQNQAIEQKLLKLIKEHYKLPLELFYKNIQFQPNQNTLDYYWWPSWLVYLAVKRIGGEREKLVNQGLKQLLLKDSEYDRFIQEFQEYIKEKN